MLILKITPSVYFNLWLKHLDTHCNKPTNQNPLKVLKVVKSTNKKTLLKMLGTSVLNSPLSHLCLEKWRILLLNYSKCEFWILIFVLLKEMNEKKASGDLDIVFKKYCGQPMTNLRKCLESFLEASHQCLKVGGKFYVNSVRVRIEILMTSLIIFLSNLCY